MLRIGKLTDYGTNALVALATAAPHDAPQVSASELAEQIGAPAEALRKVMKLLAKADLVNSTRGASGGYSLARPAAAISMAEAIEALEGPIALTECSIHDHRCNLEGGCGPRANWHLINRAIRLTLEQVSLADMAKPGSGRIAALARRVAPAQSFAYPASEPTREPGVERPMIRYD